MIATSLRLCVPMMAPQANASHVVSLKQFHALYSINAMEIRISIGFTGDLQHEKAFRRCKSPSPNISPYKSVAETPAEESTFYLDLPQKSRTKTRVPPRHPPETNHIRSCTGPEVV
ncbi:hypothetical protein SNK03_007818 [Fusarium graminearum]